MYRDVFQSFPVLETERLLIRQHRESDAEEMRKYANDPDFLRFTDYPLDYRDHIASAIHTWNNEAYASGTFIRWCIALRENNVCIGSIYLFDPVGDDQSGRRMEIGYEISALFRGRGYAAEAIGKITDFGFAQMGLKRIQALTVPENIASQKACQKCGYVYEGTLRNYRHYSFSNTLRDMVMMSCIPKNSIYKN